MNVLSLFSGIGGIDLGLERAGMRVVAQCEIDPFCRAVLAKHWPDVPRFDDVRELRGSDVSGIDLIAGGWPCQDISVAGKGRGIYAERSGLWWEFQRLIQEIRPRWVLGENVPALRTRGADEVAASLEGIGYTVAPFVVGAWAVGAQHERDRAWIVAHLERDGVRNEQGRSRGAHRCSKAVAPDASEGRPPTKSRGWSAAPRVGRMVHGLPHRVDRIRALGNSVVPQVVEAIGRAILTAPPSLRGEE